MTDIPQWAAAAIGKALHPVGPPEVWPSRYPFIYAYDFIRAHDNVFRSADTPGDHYLPENPSRIEVLAWLQIVCGVDENGSTDPGYVAVCCALADAHIVEHGYVWPKGETAETRLARHRTPDGNYDWGA